MSRTVLITQSNYIPWKGFFDAIDRSDYYVIYDVVQYTKRDWRNRNLIKTSNGLKWLSIPLEYKKRGARIDEMRIADKNWPPNHLARIEQVYKNSPYFQEVYDILEIALNSGYSYLTDVNEYILRVILSYLGISTRVIRLDGWHLPTDRNERLACIVERLKGDIYLTGPAAKAYLDPKPFKESQIKVEFMDYSGYPEYHQLYGAFEHGVSIIDLLMNTGPQAIDYIRNKERP